MDHGGRTASLLADIETEMLPGENLVWDGRPDPRVTFRRLRFLFYIGVPWTAAALLFAPAGTFALFATLAGVAILAGPGVAAWRSRHTIYRLTDRRALVLARFGGRSLVSVDLGNDETQVEVLPVAGKAGAVLFVPNLPRRISYTDHTGKFGFWDVSDAPALAAIVARALGQRGAKTSNS